MNCLEGARADIESSVDAVLQARRSVRAYTSDPVSRQTVLDVLRTASTAPSNSNTQPWRVHVLVNASLHTLGRALEAAFDEDCLPSSPHFPDPLPELLGARQAEFARRYYDALGIARDDMAARSRQSRRNLSFFGAPVGLIFSIDARLARHSWLDLGLFVQNVMIAAKARGLDTCPQVSFARFHPVIASHLSMDAQDLTACGMAMGFADPEAPVNHIRVPRLPLDAFVRIHDDPRRNE